MEVGSSVAVDLEKFYSGKKVFVTGASGFIGSHLVERLCDLGSEVIAFVTYGSRGETGFLKELSEKDSKRVKIVFGNIRERDSIKSSLEDSEVFLHLASIISIPYSYVRPEEVLDTNVVGTFNAVLAAKDSDVKRFVQTSSSEVYGTAREIPITEKHPKQPQSVYSASKIAADAMALSFYHSFETPVSVCRPFNTYGPRQSDRAVIPVIISQAIQNGRVTLGSTNTTRDFTYMSDTVDGLLTVGADEQCIGKEFNLGTGSEISIGDLVTKIGKLLEMEIPIDIDESRIRPSTSEVMQLLSSHEKLKSITGWTPKKSLDDGLRETIDWVRGRMDTFSPDTYRI